MPANNDPIFSRVADVQWIGYMVTANTTADMTLGTTYLGFTADATNGGFIRSIKFKPTPAGNTTATVCRIWINNGSTTATAANNVLFGDITLPVVTASAVAEVVGFEYPVNLPIPPGYRIYFTIATASANGWAAIVFGGKY